MSSTTVRQSHSVNVHLSSEISDLVPTALGSVHLICWTQLMYVSETGAVCCLGRGAGAGRMRRPLAAHDVRGLTIQPFALQPSDACLMTVWCRYDKCCGADEPNATCTENHIAGSSQVSTASPG